MELDRSLTGPKTSCHHHPSVGEASLPPQFPRSLWAITKDLLRINKCRIEKIRKELACRECEYLENAEEWRQSRLFCWRLGGRWLGIAGKGRENPS